MRMPDFDVVGVGLNATDTLILVPRLPPFGGKAPFTGEVLSPGGQVAGAMVACARLGLRVRYITTVGDDERGRVQMESLSGSGVNLDGVRVREGCPNQSAYILIDQATGERTVLWRRPECLRLDPSDITREMVASGRLLHIDAHDTAAVIQAARYARSAGIPVTLDVDTVYPDLDELLPLVDYLVADSSFPPQWTGESDPVRALERIQSSYGMPVAAMTLGAGGALARADGRFVYSPGFLVECRDTTGAGDVFHGAFCYAVLERMSIPDALDFSNAMAALNCTALGARGRIGTRGEAERLMRTAGRRWHPDIPRTISAQ